MRHAGVRAPLGRAMVRLVAEAHELIRTERQRCIRAAGVIAEFDFVDFRRQSLYDSADLAPKEPFCGNILQQGRHGEQVKSRTLQFNST